MRVLRLAGLIGIAQICVVVILFSSWYRVAHADTIDPQCDFTDTTGYPFSTAGLAAQCRTPTSSPHYLTATSTLYAIEYHVSTASGSNEKWIGKEGAWCEPLGNLVIPTGIQKIILPIPHTYGAGENPVVNIASHPSCAIIDATARQGAGSNPPYWYAVFYWSPEAAGIDTSTRIVPLTPATAAQTSTTTSSALINFSANYFYNANDPIFEILPFASQINLYLIRTDSTGYETYSFPITSALYFQNASINLTLPAGSSWSYRWAFESSEQTVMLATQSQTLYVITSPLGTDTTGLGAYATSTCSVLNLTGCVQNAIAFLFWPNEAAFEQFSVLSGNVRTHAPFGYVYILLGQVQQISGSAAPTFALSINPTLQTTYFDPIKNALSTILWALAAMWFFVRIRALTL